MLYKIKESLKNKLYAKPIIALLMATAIFMLYKNREDKLVESTSNSTPIEVANAKKDSLPVYVLALGTVTPYNTATIKTQVNGELVKLGFKDGSKVKKGDLLAQIDPRNYQAQLTQYQGQLHRDQALLKNSQIDLKRYQDLWEQNAISKQTLDTQVSLVKQNEGTVQLDQGLVDDAAVNLSYCNILAPFDGQVGISTVTEGNIVQTTDPNGIVVINSVDPISVVFSVPETDLSQIISEFHKNPLKAEAYDQTSKVLLSTGVLSAIDNQIDTSTGTIKLRAKFENSDYRLFPNQFVNIKLLVKTITDSIIIPTPAVQYGPNGTFVYLLNKNKTKVKVQPVETGTTTGLFTVIKSGLEINQVVAVTGVDKLKDQASVFVSGSDL
ncbi:MAG: efflux RND transporter periplasmic adaptor subunit [Rickettsiales bacterium]|jgi:multidrug efflux system membrane fusion protein|nr:efflux RND transporter periplasmic adaptor subunit [Rickettsiales bacterium]